MTIEYVKEMFERLSPGTAFYDSEGGWRLKRPDSVCEFSFYMYRTGLIFEHISLGMPSANDWDCINTDDELVDFIHWFEKTDLFDYNWECLFNFESANGLGLSTFILSKVDELPIKILSYSDNMIKYEFMNNIFTVECTFFYIEISFNGKNMFRFLSTTTNGESYESIMQALFPIGLIREWKLKELIEN
jgi:hypothetical protein